MVVLKAVGHYLITMALLMGHTRAQRPKLHSALSKVTEWQLKAANFRAEFDH